MRRNTLRRLAGSALALTFTFLFLHLAGAMAPTEDWRAQIGKPVPSFMLPNYDGKTVSSTDPKSKLTVLLFISTVCPVSNAYDERMEQMAQKYDDKGVRFLGINSNRGETPTQIAAHAKEHKFTFPVLKDNRNVIADHFQARHTPEVWVVDAHGIARYHGAIDDSQEVEEVKTPYLQNALDALLDGKEPPKTETRAFGCAIHRVSQ